MPALVPVQPVQPSGSGDVPAPAVRRWPPSLRRRGHRGCVGWSRCPTHRTASGHRDSEHAFRKPILTSLIVIALIRELCQPCMIRLVSDGGGCQGNGNEGWHSPPQQPSGALEPCLRHWLHVRVTLSVQAPRARTPLGSAPCRRLARRIAAQTPANRGGCSHPSPPQAPKGAQPGCLSQARQLSLALRQLPITLASCLLHVPSTWHQGGERNCGLCGACDSPLPSTRACWQRAAGGSVSFCPWYPSGDGQPGSSLAAMPTQQGLGPRHGTGTASLCVTPTSVRAGSQGGGRAPAPSPHPVPGCKHPSAGRCP